MHKREKLAQELALMDDVSFHGMVHELLIAEAFPSVYKCEYGSLSNVGLHTYERSSVKGQPDILCTGKKNIAFAIGTDKNNFKKLKDDIDKQINRKYDKFIFFTNRKSNGQIKLKRKNYPGDQYCVDLKIIKDLKNFSCIDAEQIISVLCKPEFSYIRKQYCNLEDDYFLSQKFIYDEFSKKSSLTELEKSEFWENFTNYCTFDNSKIYIINASDQNEIDRIILALADLNNKEHIIQFTKWCGSDIEFTIYENEVKYLRDHYIATVVDKSFFDRIVRFIQLFGITAINTSLIFFVKNEDSSEVFEKIKSVDSSLNLVNLSYEELFNIHENTSLLLKKNSSLIQNHIKNDLSDKAKKYQSLIYWYRPLKINDVAKRRHIRKLVNINAGMETYIILTLTSCGIVKKEDNYLILNNLELGKKLIEGYINQSVFSIKDL